MDLSVTPNINLIVSTWPNKRFLSHSMLPLSGHDDAALFDWRRLWRWINTKIKNYIIIASLKSVQQWVNW